MKHLLFVILLAVACCSVSSHVAAQAIPPTRSRVALHDEEEVDTTETFVVNGFKYLINSDKKTVSLTYTVMWHENNYGNLSGKISIPAEVTYNGKLYRVTAIGNDAFEFNRRITEVYIPGSVTKIGNYAFESCSGLTRIVVPNTVTKIGNYAFESCTSLACVVIGKSVTRIGNQAFAYCPNITEFHSLNVTPPAMGEHCFHGVDSEVTVYVPGNSIAAYMRAGGWQYFGNFTSDAVPGQVFYCGDFKYMVNDDCVSVSVVCTSHTSKNYSMLPRAITIPQTVTDYQNTFTVTTIGEEAFKSCSQISMVSLPKTITAIGASAFENCTNLTTIYLGNSLVTVGNRAFSGCSALNGVELPNTLWTVGDWAFSGCTSLGEIHSLNPQPPAVGYNSFESVNRSIPLYVPALNINDYKAAEGWKEFSNTHADRTDRGGDVNADGVVDISDANILSNILLAKDSADKYNGRADVNEDGTVDVSDVNDVINKLLSK